MRPGGVWPFGHRDSTVADSGSDTVAAVAPDRSSGLVPAPVPVAIIAAMTQPPPQYPGPPQDSGPGYPAPQPPGAWQAPSSPDAWQTQPQPGQPAVMVGQPPPPDGGPVAWQSPMTRPGTNSFATASFVFGLIGGVPLSVIFGIVALVQIRKRSEGGKGLAIAGLVLSGVWTTVFAVGLVVTILTGADRNSSGEITDGGSVAVADLAVGDCVNGLEATGEVHRLPAVPCTEPHEGEVYAIFDMEGSAFPSEQAVIDAAEKTCGDRFESYASESADVDSLELYFLGPSERSWRLGDKGVTCIAYDPSTKRTGSLRG